MNDRKVVLYYSWSRPEETGAPLEVVENRFPALFESRRMLYPRFEDLSDPARFDQGVAGFLDHIMKTNFVDLCRAGPSDEAADRRGRARV